MQHHWRKLLSVLPDNVERAFYKRYFKQEHKRLQQNNPSGFASNFTKQEVLRQIMHQYSINTLVETGTYLGDTLYALYNDFEKIYSIELSPLYFEKAQHRFRNYPRIALIQGDSGKELFRLLPGLNEPALFWLDGHYSAGLTAKGEKECPIFEELTAILQSSVPHVIVVDDARCFVGQNDYPTIPELKEFVQKHRANYKITVDTDSIRILPEG